MRDIQREGATSLLVGSPDRLELGSGVLEDCGGRWSQYTSMREWKGAHELTGLLDRARVLLVELGKAVFASRGHEVDELGIIERHAGENLETRRRDTALVRACVAEENDCGEKIT